jgi:hypothetical protein
VIAGRSRSAQRGQVLIIRASRKSEPNNKTEKQRYQRPAVLFFAVKQPYPFTVISGFTFATLTGWPGFNPA